MFYVFSFVQRNEGKQLQAGAHLLPSELDTILLRSPCSPKLRFVTVRVWSWPKLSVFRDTAPLESSSHRWYCVCPGRVCVVPLELSRSWAAHMVPGPDWLCRTPPHLAQAHHSTWPLHDASWAMLTRGPSIYNVVGRGRGQPHHRYSPHIRWWWWGFLNSQKKRGA